MQSCGGQWGGGSTPGSRVGLLGGLSMGLACSWGGEEGVSGRGCGGPGPVGLLAVPWGWDVMQGAMWGWGGTVVQGAVWSHRETNWEAQTAVGLAWGVKQGMERIGVPSSILRLGGGEGLVTLLRSPGV